MVLAKSCFYDNTIKGYVRACKPWQYLQGSPSQKSLLEVYNVAFLIWVFINCQSRVRIPGFSSYVCIVMVYITLFYFHTFADVHGVVRARDDALQSHRHRIHLFGQNYANLPVKSWNPASERWASWSACSSGLFTSLSGYLILISVIYRG